MWAYFWTKDLFVSPPLLFFKGGQLDKQQVTTARDHLISESGLLTGMRPGVLTNMLRTEVERAASERVHHQEGEELVVVRVQKHKTGRFQEGYAVFTAGGFDHLLA